MNHLAHCLIGAARNDLIVGGFAGDHFRGRPTDLPAPLRAGVLLHRRADALSAGITAFRTAADLLGAQHRRVAPILVDVITDHHLARHFDRFHDEPLADFEHRVHDALARWRRLLPASAQAQAEGFRRHRLLSRYDSPAVVESALLRVARRGSPRLEQALTAAVPAAIDRLEAFEGPCLRGLAELRAQLAGAGADR